MKEKVILVGINIKKQIDLSYSLEELHNLSINMNYCVVDVLTQNIHNINPVYYIGKGKLEELKEIVIEKEVKIVIFNEELSASQVKNLEEYLNCQVIDRSNLILDIFNKRATTKESVLQVEIARLQYLLPRLINSDEKFSRQRGGGVITRGSGETDLESNRRLIETKIKKLKKELEEVILAKKTQRNLRQKSDVKIVSLIDYTNTGKSTLFK